MIKQFSEDEIRAAINENDPREAFAIAITLFQRLVVALETIAADVEPQPMLREHDA